METYAFDERYNELYLDEMYFDEDGNRHKEEGYDGTYY